MGRLKKKINYNVEKNKHSLKIKKWVVTSVRKESFVPGRIAQKKVYLKTRNKTISFYFDDIISNDFFLSELQTLEHMDSFLMCKIKQTKSPHEFIIKDNSGIKKLLRLVRIKITNITNKTSNTTEGPHECQPCFLCGLSTTP